MINWKKYFDHIFILSRCSNFDRRGKLNQELKRIGLYDYVTYLYQPDSELLTYDGYKNPYMTKAKVRCNYAHYSCIKMAYELNYDNILICEDDIVFYKDINKIKELLEEFYNNRDNYNIYLFDYISKEDQKILMDENEGNGVLCAGCYYLDIKGMKYLIYCLENFKELFNDSFFYTVIDKYYGLTITYYLDGFSEIINIPMEENLLPITIRHCNEHMVQQKSFIDDEEKNLYGE